jgi:hypothetical protein
LEPLQRSLLHDDGLCHVTGRARLAAHLPLNEILGVPVARRATPLHLVELLEQVLDRLLVVTVHDVAPFSARRCA